MAVKLRLRRAGAKNKPRYRVVAADARSPRDGRFIEVIGYYDPTRQPHQVTIDETLALKWLERGAQPTETVRDLLAQQGILDRFLESRGKRAAPRPGAAGAEGGAPAGPQLGPEPAAGGAPEGHDAAAESR